MDFMSASFNKYCNKVHQEKQLQSFCFSFYYGGWSGGAMVLGKLLVPGRPTGLDYSRARAFCACGRCRWGVGHFFCRLSFLFSFSLMVLGKQTSSAGSSY